jgi:hypothetical protein
VVDYEIDEIPEVPIEVIVGWEKRPGKKDRPIKEDVMVRGVRASVRVRNAKNGNISLAIAEQPRYMVLKDGGKSADKFATTKAVSKATRNAIMDHFAAVEALITEFVLNARKAGRAYISVADVAPPAALAAADDVQQGLRSLESRTVEPLGNTEGNVFWEWAGAQAKADPKLKAGLIPDIKAFISRTWGAQNVQDVPAAHKRRLYEFVCLQVGNVTGTAPVNPVPAGLGEVTPSFVVPPAAVVPPPAPAVVPPPVAVPVPAVPADPAPEPESAPPEDEPTPVLAPPAAPTGPPGEEPAIPGAWAELVAVAEDLAMQLNMDPEGFDAQLMPLAATYAETGDVGPLQTYVGKLQGLLDARANPAKPRTRRIPIPEHVVPEDEADDAGSLFDGEES